MTNSVIFKEQRDKFLTEYCKSFEAVYITFDVKKQHITFKCKCGQTVTKHYSNSKGMKILCNECILKYHSEHISNRISANEVKQWFESYGSELLSDYTKCNARTELVFRCKCDKISHTRYSRRKANGKPVCYDCSRKMNQGPNHPNYKDIPDEERIHRKRRSAADKTFKREVLKRDNYTCIISGSKENLCAHHLYSFGANKELRVEALNGVMITRDLHKEFHIKYGFGNNTLEQFKEFFKDKTGREFIWEVENSN